MVKSMAQDMITHSLDPILAEFGPFTVRYYGLLLAGGLAGYLLIEKWIFKREGLSLEKLYNACFYLVLGLIIGARLGFIIFYSFGYYWANPEDVFKIWEGGLSSHGAAIGLVAAYCLYFWREKKKDPDFRFYRFADLLVIAMPVVAACVRIGNFINSEIVGRATDLPWGVVFALTGDPSARHPVQIYECLAALIIFAVLLLVYIFYYKKAKPYFMLSLFVLVYFSTRFLLEFFKEFQVISGPLTMGQVLSVLPVMFSLGYFLFVCPRLDKTSAP